MVNIHLLTKYSCQTAGCKQPYSISYMHILNTTRSAQRAQTSAERQHNRSSSESGFRTLDSWIRTVIRIVTKIEHIGPWSVIYTPPRNFAKRQLFQLSDGQADRQTEVKT